MITEVTVTIAMITAMTEDVVSESVAISSVSGGVLSEVSAFASIETEIARKRASVRLARKRTDFLMADTCILLRFYSV